VCKTPFLEALITHRSAPKPDEIPVKLNILDGNETGYPSQPTMFIDGAKWAEYKPK
jgi:hypothetical protein